MRDLPDTRSGRWRATLSVFLDRDHRPDGQQEALFAAALLVEIPMAMVLLSRFLLPSASLWANLVAGTVMTAVQLTTLFVGGGPTVYDAFFSVVEIACTAYIVLTAWTWRVMAPARSGRARFRPMSRPDPL